MLVLTLAWRADTADKIIWLKSVCVWEQFYLLISGHRGNEISWYWCQTITMDPKNNHTKFGQKIWSQWSDIDNRYIDFVIGMTKKFQNFFGSCWYIGPSIRGGLIASKNFVIDRSDRFDQIDRLSMSHPVSFDEMGPAPLDSSRKTESNDILYPI